VSPDCSGLLRGKHSVLAFIRELETYPNGQAYVETHLAFLTSLLTFGLACTIQLSRFSRKLPPPGAKYNIPHCFGCVNHISDLFPKKFCSLAPGCNLHPSAQGDMVSKRRSDCQVLFSADSAQKKKPRTSPSPTLVHYTRIHTHCQCFVFRRCTSTPAGRWAPTFNFQRIQFAGWGYGGILPSETLACGRRISKQ